MDYLKPYFVYRDYKKDHLKRIEEATSKCQTVSIKGLFEASIRTERYGRLLQNEFIRISNLFNYSNFDTTVSLMKFLNTKFDKYLIHFKFDSTEPDKKEWFCGISEMFIDGNNKYIVILCNNRFRKKFLNQDEELFETFYELICHELTHRGQFLLRRYEQSLSILNKKLKKDKEIQDNTDLTDIEKERLLIRNYLSDVNEIMAYANQIVEELRFKGLSDKDIIKLVKGFKIPSEYSTSVKMYNEYFTLTNKEDYKILKKLFTYIYGYITGKEKHSFII